MLAQEFPYGEWLRKHRIHLEEITSGRKTTPKVADYEKKKGAFGYFEEEIEECYRTYGRHFV